MSKNKSSIKNIKSLRERTGFNLDNYSTLENMSDYHLLLLLEKRCAFRERFDRNYWWFDYFNYKNIDDINTTSDDEFKRLAIDWTEKKYREIKMLFNAPLVIEERLNSSKVPSAEDASMLSLSHGDGIYPMDRGDLIAFARSRKTINGLGAGMPFIPSEDGIAQLEEDEGFPFDDFLCESIDLLVEKNPHDKKGHFVIDFEKSDSELIASFTSQIGKWRGELNMDNVGSSKSWVYIKNRVLEYKVIPLMDLLAFSELSGVQIPSRILALALFPNGERDGFGISQTVRPFIDKYITNFSIWKYKKQFYI